MKTTDGLWMIAGIGIGAGVTYLFATRQGRRLRRNLYRKADQYRAKFVAGTQDMLENGREILEQRGREVFEKGKDLRDSGKEFFKNSADKLMALR